MSTDFYVVLNTLSVDDLDYIEKDLRFYELAALAFLLYGKFTKLESQIALQKLLIKHNNSNAEVGLLRNYALELNPNNWRPCLIEALSIINAGRVLRKLGFPISTIKHIFLPHVSSLSIHIDPVLKTLYRISEQMPINKAGRLVLFMAEKYKEAGNHLRFYDYSILEVFMLDWITEGIISSSNVQNLLVYFKQEELDEYKRVLTDTLKFIDNTDIKPDSLEVSNSSGGIPEATVSSNQNDNQSNTNNNETDRYAISRERVGFALIINNREFHRETDSYLVHMLPENNLSPRNGSDEDKRRLIEVLSSFGYQTEYSDDLSHVEIMHKIREISKMSIIKDSLIVCILSHGINGAIYGSNSIPVRIDEIIQIINSELKGKPKLLILQACQTYDLKTTEILSKNIPKNDSPKNYIDLLITKASIPGFPAMRHTIAGSWFIQTLCEELDKLGDQKDLVTILYSVTAKISEKKGHKKDKKDKDLTMINDTQITLRKAFFLPTRKMT